jgi:hypothetical protein
MAKKLLSKSKYVVLRYQSYHGKISAYLEKIRYIYIGNFSHAPIPEGLIQLEFLKQELKIKKNIIIVSGIGISTNIGSKFQITAANSSVLIIICDR